MEYITLGITCLSLILLVMTYLLARRTSADEIARLIDLRLQDSARSQTDVLRQEAGAIRQEIQTALSTTRTEMNGSIDRLRQASTDSFLQLQNLIGTRLADLQKLTGDVAEKQALMHAEMGQQLQSMLTERLGQFHEFLVSNSDRNSQLLTDIRKETVETLQQRLENIQKTSADASQKHIATATENFLNLQKAISERLSKFDETLIQNTDRISQALADNRKETVDTLNSRLESLQKTTADASQQQLTTLTDVKEKLSESLSGSLKELQQKNEEKLEQMRMTVDEKLQQTLHTRLTESFEVVTKQLLEVQRGLSEMQTLAQDVGGLKKALTNIKVRGIIGEAQLKALLEQFLTEDQYSENVPTKPRGSERVEFAVKLPGTESGEPILLPIDSKFPIEDYQRLQEAYEAGDKAAWDQAGKAFEDRLYKHAADISSKYINVPHTTDFGLMFLPFESLYGEAIRRPGLFQAIQTKYKINIVGPTTLVAFLNSLQVGFKTLAISKQSSEVWKVLGAVKTEFGKFGDAVSKVQKNLENASSNLSHVSTRARQMEKKLSKVSALSAEDSLALLPEDLPLEDSALTENDE